jgi:hypothetical protein
MRNTPLALFTDVKAAEGVPTAHRWRPIFLSLKISRSGRNIDALGQNKRGNE